MLAQCTTLLPQRKVPVLASARRRTQPPVLTWAPSGWGTPTAPLGTIPSHKTVDDTWLEAVRTLEVLPGSARPAGQGSGKPLTVSFLIHARWQGGCGERITQRVKPFADTDTIL